VQDALHLEVLAGPHLGLHRPVGLLEQPINALIVVAEVIGVAVRPKQHGQNAGGIEARVPPGSEKHVALPLAQLVQQVVLLPNSHFSPHPGRPHRPDDGLRDPFVAGLAVQSDADAI